MPSTSNSHFKKFILCGFAALLTTSSVFAKDTVILTVGNNDKDDNGFEYLFILKTDESNSKVLGMDIKTKLKENEKTRKLPATRHFALEKDVIKAHSIVATPQGEEAYGISGAILVPTDKDAPAIFLQTPQQRNAEIKSIGKGTEISGTFGPDGGKVVFRYIQAGIDAIAASKVITYSPSSELRAAAQKTLSKAYGSIALVLAKNGDNWVLSTAQKITSPECIQRTESDISSKFEFHHMFLNVIPHRGFGTPCVFNK